MSAQWGLKSALTLCLLMKYLFLPVYFTEQNNWVVAQEQHSQYQSLTCRCSEHGGGWFNAAEGYDDTFLLTTEDLLFRTLSLVSLHHPMMLGWGSVGSLYKQSWHSKSTKTLRDLTTRVGKMMRSLCLKEGPLLSYELDLNMKHKSLFANYAFWMNKRLLTGDFRHPACSCLGFNRC